MDTKKKTILVCDDELGIRESLRLILGNDYNLVFACNADECLNKLKNENNLDLLLLDIKMPKLSGLDILKDIKKSAPKLKVIIITGYKSVETATEASKLGADDYIVKPFESKEILQIVEKLLGR